jgi:hypothetical protein
MFKAMDEETGQPVIILDVIDGDSLKCLRDQGRSGRLTCPMCHHCVRVKAGDIKRHHFAHWSLANCPAANESSELLHAREILYCWLKNKFPKGVTLEKWITDLPHPIDCWVETGASTSFAYWIVEKNRNLDYRNKVAAAERSSGVPWNFILLSSMMHPTNTSPEELILSPTERAFLRRSDYDAVHAWNRANSCGSLHYMDPVRRELTTYRSLCRGTCRQQYHGVKLNSPVDQLLLTPKTGALCHPGEKETFLAWRVKEKKRLDEERQYRAQMQHLHSPAPVAVPSGRRSARSLETVPPLPAAPETPEGVCMECGQRTRDWWMYSGKTGQCRCNPCLRKRQAAQQTRE